MSAYQLLRVTSNESNYGPFCIQRHGENEWRTSFRNEDTEVYETKHKNLNGAVSFINSNIDKLKSKHPNIDW